jgi:D-glycero-D-manno-heptose 1,7-bisphosphate phosphatase
MRLIVLDRDGVINEDSPSYIRSPAEIRPIEGSLRAIARLTQAGWHVAVATNQSGLARGFFSVDTLNRMHAVLVSGAAAVGGRIECFAFCPHGPDEGCGCRKPAPGLLLMLARRYAVPTSSVVFVGDSRRDLQAARAVGAQPILVRTGNGAATEAALPEALRDVPVFIDLAAVVEALLQAPPR